MPLPAPTESVRLCEAVEVDAVGSGTRTDLEILYGQIRTRHLLFLRQLLQDRPTGQERIEKERQDTYEGGASQSCHALGSRYADSRSGRSPTFAARSCSRLSSLLAWWSTAAPERGTAP